MSYSPPKVFISANATSLRSVRKAITEALLSIGCVPVEAASFEPDSVTVAGVLRETIESCQALVHVAGTRYGPEPDPATLPAGAPRRSYTQMEYHIGCEVKEQRGDKDFFVYVFVCPEDFPFDPVPGIEISEKWALQDAHRNQLLKSPYFCGGPESADEMREWALGLQKQFPPPPPPPPPSPPEKPKQNEMPVVPYSEKLDWLAAQAAQPLPEMPSHPPQAWIPGNTPGAPSAPKRSRLPLVLGVLAAMGVVSILAAAWVFKQKGFFGHQVALQKKPEIKSVPTVKADSRATPEPKPSTPAPTPVLVTPPPPPQPQPPAILPTPPAPPTPTPPVAEKPVPPPSPTPTPVPARTAEINLVRRASLAADPASKLSSSEVGKLYVEKPLYNGKTFTREDVVRQTDEFRRNWDVQILDILEGPTVTAGADSNRVIVKVRTRLVGVRKTSIHPSTIILTSEYGVLRGADGTPLIESIRELSREN